MKTLEITFKDGARFSGAGPIDIVNAMKDHSYFTAGKTPDEYMRGYSHRLSILFGETLPTTSVCEFVWALIMSPEVAKVRITNR